MLTIRDAQFDAFARHAATRMQARVSAVLATAFPGANSTTLTAAVEHGMEAGIALGLERDSDFALVIALDLAWRTLPLQEPDWVGATLRQAAIAGPVKLALIESRLASLATGQAPFQDLCAALAGVRLRLAP